MTKYEVEKSGVRHTQLFNLKYNPHEFIKEHHDPEVIALTGIEPGPNQMNLAGKSKYAAKLKDMEALLLEQMRRHDDPYRLWNQPGDGLPTPIVRNKTGKRKQPKKPNKSDP